ncbi:MAG: T9SS type A sorting domain-containing protein [Bacteroidota bacterium]
MKLSFFLLLLWWWGSLIAQTDIIYGEYFVDTDPGRGNGTPFMGFVPDDSVSMSATLNPNDYPPGLHVIYTRVQDADQVWSQRHFRPILILPEEVAPIEQVEYFWDQDPGQGNGFAPTTSFSPADSVEVTWSIEVDTLSPGIHRLYVRARNDQGRWGHPHKQATLIQALPQSPIQQLDYYFTWSVDSQSVTYTYPLAQPQFMVEVSFEPVVTDLVNSGDYTFCITALTTDSLRSFESCADFVWQGDSTTDTTTTSLPLSGQQLAWKAYPNPTMDFLTVGIPPSEGPVFVTLANAQGQTLLRLRQDLPNEPSFQLDLRSYPPGSYLLIIEQGPHIHACPIQKN